MRNETRWACSVVVVALLGQPLARAAPAPPDITSASLVNRLSEQEAARRPPLRIEGTVVYSDGAWGLLFVTGDSGTVFLDPLALPATPALGTRLEVEGVASWLRGAAGVSPRSARARGQAPLPAAKPLTAVNDSVVSPAWVSLEGVVHAVSAEPGRGRLRLDVSGVAVRVRVPEPAAPTQPDLVDARVRLQGVFESRPGTNREPRLWMPGWSALTVLEPAPATSALPIRTVAEVRGLAGSPAAAAHRVRVAVRVAGRRSMTRFLVEDDSGQMEAELKQPDIVQQGGRIDLAGFVSATGDRLALVDTLSLAITNAGTAPSARDPGLRTLRTAAEIRALSRGEAARGHPVLIEGVVSYSDPGQNHLFVQDGSAGVYVHTGFHDLGVVAGSRVRLRGFTGPGDLAPIVVDPVVQITGWGPLPPATPVGAARLLSGQDDCRRVQVTAIVHSVQRVEGRIVYALDAEGQRIRAYLPRPAADLDPDALVDAKVRVSAVCGTYANWRRQLDSVVLFVSSPGEVEVLERPVVQAFSLPRTLVAEMLRVGGEQRFGRRLRASGVVLHQTPDRRLFLRDGTGTLCVTLLRSLPTFPGEEVDVVGFPSPGRFSPALEDAVGKIVARGPVPRPVAVTAGQLLGGAHDGDLVSLQAVLHDVVPTDTGLHLAARSGETLFEAVLETEQPAAATYERGSRVELQGIADLREEAGGEGSRVRVLLRTPLDVRVLERPSWWTPQRVRWVFLGLAGVLVASLAWVLTLRREVRARTRELRSRMDREAEIERHLRAELERRVEERTRELSELQKRLIREERLAALGKITTTVSHELRNPLATIGGSLFLIGEALGAGPSRPRRALERAERNVRRANEIIEELLDYARTRPLHRARTDVDTWLRQGRADLAVPGGVELRLDLESGAVAELDGPRLLRCVINLVANAAEAILGTSPPATQKGTTIELGTRLADGRVEIRVQDDGPGIPSELLDQVFEPFFSTKDKGVGLGLSLVRQIAQQHGGGVTLTSRPGDTTFTLWLPVAERREAEARRGA